MKKLLIIASLFAMTNVKAQGYYHGLGIQFNYVAFTGTNYSNIFGTPGIYYKATYTFGANKVTPAISAYPYVGAFLQGGSGSIGAELPIMGEVYFGDIEDLAFNIGAGFNFSYWANDLDNGSVVGPRLELGGQFYISGKLMGIRAGYTHGLTKTVYYEYDGTEHSLDNKLFNLGFHYYFGQ